MDKNKLEQNVNAFKDFILDEYNNLLLQLQQSETENKRIIDKYNDRLNKYNSLLEKYGKLETTIVNLNSSLDRQKNIAFEQYQTISKFEFKEKQILALTASYAEEVKINNSLKDKNKQQSLIITKLIEQLNKLGYNVDILSLDDINTIKESLSNKYHVTEKPNNKKTDTEFITNLISSALKKNGFDVMQTDNVWKDLFVDPQNNSTNKKVNRDNKGRFTSAK